MKPVKLISHTIAFRRRRIYLALTYLVIIMALTSVFSVVIYRISSYHFDRLVMSSHMQPLDIVMLPYSDVIANHQQEARNDLLRDLILLNLATLVGGAIFSYYLASRSLKPIEDITFTQAQFISDASHELRTPLATLQTSNEVALMSQDELTPEIKQLLESNIHQTERLRGLADSLLSLNRLDNDKPQVKIKVKLSQLIAETIEPILLSDQQKRLVVNKTGQQLSVRVNEESTIRILSIFIENALKYSPVDSKVRVSVSRANRSVLVNVTDRGAGIAESDIDKIFSRFYRGDSSRSTQNQKGYGIGLSIAKAISEKQRTPISVDSKVGKGSTFSVRLPIVK